MRPILSMNLRGGVGAVSGALQRRAGVRCAYQCIFKNGVLLCGGQLSKAGRDGVEQSALTAPRAKIGARSIQGKVSATVRGSLAVVKRNACGRGAYKTVQVYEQTGHACQTTLSEGGTRNAKRTHHARQTRRPQS